MIISSPRPFFRHRHNKNPFHITALVGGWSGCGRGSDVFETFGNKGPVGGGRSGRGGFGLLRMRTRARACFFSLLTIFILYKSTPTTLTRAVISRLFAPTACPDQPRPPRTNTINLTNQGKLT